MQNERYINIDSSYFNPNAVYVQSGRAHAGSDINGTPWNKANDEYTAQAGYDYSVENAVHMDTLGWEPGIKVA